MSEFTTAKVNGIPLKRSVLSVTTATQSASFYRKLDTLESKKEPTLADVLEALQEIKQSLKDLEERLDRD